MSLFDIEIKSHWLKEQIGKPHSTRLKLLYLSNFLLELIKSGTHSKYISYFNEFVPELVKLILRNEFRYFSPYEIESLLFIVKSLEPLNFSKENSERCLGVLQNARNEILSLLSGIVKTEAKAHKNSINVVLIEANSDEKGNVGTIQTLTLRSSKRGKEFLEDKIEFENLCENDQEKMFSYITNIVSFSKEQTKKIISKTNAYNLTFSFENKDCSYTGSSFGLALLALAYNSVLVNELRKIYYKFFDDVVITGAIDEKGDLLKLDSSSLKVKIETVFFSRFNKFVIPEDNIVEAKEILVELQKEYPQRKVELIPSANFKSVLLNLAVVEVNKLKIKEKLKANYESYHRTANWTFTFIALLAIIYLITGYAIPYMDTNPVYTNLTSDRYAAYNKYGKVVWESPTLSQLDINVYKADNTGKLKRILLSDLDDDGFNEILLLISSEKNKLMNRTLFCYNHDGSIKWKTHIQQKDSLYGSDYCSNDILLRMMFLLEQNGKKEIVVHYRICLLFPDYTAKISSDGKIISEFYNPGAITSLISSDIDEDGKKELFCAGMNNDYEKSGALVVFDTDLIMGAGPGYRFPRNVSTGLMKYYLLFPKTDVGRFTNHGSRMVGPVEIHDNRIVVYLKELDGFRDLKNEECFQVYTTIYTLDKSLNVLHVETSSEFDARYKQLVEEGKLKPVKDWKKYKEKLKSLVKYWDGDKFINYPTMNKYYLLAKAERPTKTAKN